MARPSPFATASWRVAGLFRPRRRGDGAMTRRARPLAIDLTEASASLADLGTVLPIAVALVAINGVDPVAAFGLAGAFFVASALWYRLPVPVQPLKAAAAIALATGAAPAVIAGAGLILGVVLLVLAATRLIRVVVRLFPKPVIRGIQLGLGLLLLDAAFTLLGGRAASAAAIAAAVGVAVAMILGERRRAPVVLAAVVAGVAWAAFQGGAVPGLQPSLPSLAVPGRADLLLALGLLVVPQLPLTLGNAIVSTADLAREYYGERARRVTPDALCVSGGGANVMVGLLGGMPMCHGSGGLTAYYRQGARTGGSNLVVGVLLLGVGVLFGRDAIAVAGLVPVTVLAGLLAYTGVRHAHLATDMRGWALAVTVVTALAGATTGNLAIGMAAGLALHTAVRRRIPNRANRDPRT